MSVTEPRRQVAFPYQWMQELTISGLGPPSLDFRLGLTGNARSDSDEEPRDVRARIVMTRVVESRAGTHQITAGVEHATSCSETRAGIPGDIEYRFFDGTPLR